MIQIDQIKHEEDSEEQKSSDSGDCVHRFIPLQVHEEQRDKHCFARRDNKRDRDIRRPKVDIRCADRDAGKDQQADQVRSVDSGGRRDDVVRRETLMCLKE